MYGSASYRFWSSQFCVDLHASKIEIAAVVALLPKDQRRPVMSGRGNCSLQEVQDNKAQSCSTKYAQADAQNYHNT